MPVHVQPMKKHFYQRVWFWLLVVVAVTIAGCSALVVGVDISLHHLNLKLHVVVYSVTGTGTATITYNAFDDNHNGSAQASKVRLPWTKTIVELDPFNVYSVTATVGASGGTATCTLSVDYKQVSTNTASGAFSAATCTGSAS